MWPGALEAGGAAAMATFVLLRGRALIKLGGGMQADLEALALLAAIAVVVSAVRTRRAWPGLGRWQRVVSAVLLGAAVAALTLFVWP